MAVDTATKRYSMINFGDGDRQFAVPDGTITTGDRQELLALYSGLAADAPAVGGTGTMMMLGMGV